MEDDSSIGTVQERNDVFRVLLKFGTGVRCMLLSFF